MLFHITRGVFFFFMAVISAKTQIGVLFPCFHETTSKCCPVKHTVSSNYCTLTLDFLGREPKKTPFSCFLRTTEPAFSLRLYLYYTRRKKKKRSPSNIINRKSFVFKVTLNDVGFRKLKPFLIHRSCFSISVAVSWWYCSRQKHYGVASVCVWN